MAAFAKRGPCLPHSPDHSDTSDTLPEPELNPLLNPLLGQHMGRWAEAYFTAPPEKRNEAVIELLRELQAENSSNGGSAAAADHGMREAANPGDTPNFTDVEPKSIRCHACGEMSPADQKFCGMCGAPFEEATSPAGPASNKPEKGLEYVPVEELLPSQPGTIAPDAIGPDAMASGTLANLEPHEPGEGITPARERSTPPRTEPTTWHRNDELSLFRSVAGVDREFEEDGDGFSRSRSYRVYIGAALTFLLLGLVYVAWQGTQSNGNRGLPPRPPAESAAPASTGAPDTPSEAATKSPDVKTAAPAPAQPPADTRASKIVNQPAAVKPAPRASAPPAASTAGNNPPPDARTGSGAEELATARRYLDGANGERRNSEEAVQWLWKAVAKRNAEATLLLSDRYLRGDGVAKNCDQARVLLDAAAAKGMKAASDRLRNFQAFGCQ